MKLLFVDADLHCVEMFTGWLRTRGYEVHCASTEEHAKIVWKKQLPDLVILSTTLKDVDTMAMWREMYTRHDTLAIALTEGKDVEEEVRWLESGVDDYLRKPFLPALLLARIHAVSRRVRSLLAPNASFIISGGSLRVNSLYNEVTIDGKVAHLTLTESRLLHVLAVNANTACTASQIVAHLWGLENDKTLNLIKYHIYRLRKKIEPNPSNPCYILTLPGEGYTLATKVIRLESCKMTHLNQ
ncbi:MAG: response regulator transcription factor [Ktedonobacteraceae bacterium]